VLLHGCVKIGPYLAKIRSLCKFVLKDPRRAGFIREISLFGTHDEIDADNAHVERELAAVISQAQNIQVLRLEPDCETLLSYWPNLAPAIASLRSVTRFHVKHIGERTEAMILTMRSPVTSAWAHFHTRDWSKDDPVDPDPSYHFQHFSETLETLSIVEFVSYRLSPSVLAQAKFPRLRTLTLETCNRPDIQAILDAFPNLSHFRWIADLDISLSRAEKTRQQNILNGGSGQGRSLDQLSIDIFVCYYSAVMLQVRYWHAGTLHVDHIPIFHTVMSSMQPTALSIRIAAANLEQGGFDGLSFPFPLVERMNLNVNLDRCLAPVADVLERLVDCLQEMSLVFLNLEIQHNNGLWDPYNVYAKPSYPTLDYIRGMDVDAYARLLAERIPTLENVFIHFRGTHTNVVRPSACLGINRSTDAETGVQIVTRVGDVGEMMGQGSSDVATIDCT